jgi:hypothetical protein
VRFGDPWLYLACFVALAGCSDDRAKHHASHDAPPVDASSEHWADNDAGPSDGGSDAGLADAALPSDLTAALQAVGFEVVAEHESVYGGYRYIDLTVTQPMDHDNPASETFEQRIILHHRDTAAPMVLATTGYQNFDQEWLMEPALVLQGNQIMVEHRYFPPSIPKNANWTKLNIRQAAGDFHLITQKLKRIYGARWLNTGASKGGMTALFHRRFFPSDVDATVAYVAPLSFGAPDNRYVQFLADINPDGCGDNVRALALRFIKDRVAIGKELLSGGFDTGPDITNEEQAAMFAAETAVYYEWGFWQYSGVDSCALVASALTNDHHAATLLSHEIVIGEAVEVPPAYNYQAASELGYQGISTAYLDEAIQEAMLPAPPAEPMPWGSGWPAYHPEAVRDVADWIAKSGERIMLIYGEYDPWTGGAIDLGAAKDSRKFVVPQGNHGSQIDLLPAEHRALALDMLYGWAAVTPPPSDAPMEKARVHVPRVDTRLRSRSLGAPPADN